MNKSHVLYHLREAQQQLSQMIEGLENDAEYEYGDYMPDMSHLYHHINSAWNGQNASDERVESCSEENFNFWRSMPSDEDVLLVP